MGKIISLPIKNNLPVLTGESSASSSPNQSSKLSRLDFSALFAIVVLCLVGLHTIFEHFLIPYLPGHRPKILFTPQTAIVFNQNVICKDQPAHACLQEWAGRHVQVDKPLDAAATIAWPPSVHEVTNLLTPQSNNGRSLVGIVVPYEIAKQVDPSDYFHLGNKHASTVCIRGVCKESYEHFSGRELTTPIDQIMFSFLDTPAVKENNWNISHNNQPVWLWYSWNHNKLDEVIEYAHVERICEQSQNPMDCQIPNTQPLAQSLAQHLTQASVMPEANLQISRIQTNHQASHQYWIKEHSLSAFFFANLADESIFLNLTSIFFILIVLCGLMLLVLLANGFNASKKRSHCPESEAIQSEAQVMQPEAQVMQPEAPVIQPEAMDLTSPIAEVSKQR